MSPSLYLLLYPFYSPLVSTFSPIAQAPDGTVSLNLGWGADTDALMSNAEIPKVLNASVIIHPNQELTSATAPVSSVIRATGCSWSGKKSDLGEGSTLEEA